MIAHLKKMSVFSLIASTAIMTSLSGCSEQQAEEVDDPTIATEPVYMSFSGGGYHAHAGASAAMMGMMDRARSKSQSNTTIGMADITKNVAALSSNSGGSWFLSQAAYSKYFLDSIEAPDAWQTFTTDKGYFGQAYEYISSLDMNQDICLPLKKVFPAEYEKCRKDFENADSYLKFLMSGGDGNWHELANNAVFGAKFKDPAWHVLATDADQALSATRQDWAANKSLVFASALLTDAPALNHTIDWVTIRSLQGSQNNAVVPGATPVIFGVAGASTDTVPNFLPGGDVSLQYGTALSIDGLFQPDKKIDPVSVPADTSINGAKIIDVAASSSAAGAGFIDLPDMVKSDPPVVTAALLANFAPAFTLQYGAVYNGPFGDDLDQRKLADEKAVRLADGGFVDNTAVAYMLRYMADNDKIKDGFNILAMDNYPKQPITFGPQKIQLPTGPDVAGLFGFPDPTATKHTSDLFGLFSYTGIVPHVFDSAAYFTGTGEDAKLTKGPDWCAWIEPEGTKPGNCSTIKVSNPDPTDPKCDMYLSYTHYTVTVVDNPYFGIKGSKAKGNLHVFSNLGANAGVVPDSNAQARCYGKLMEAVNTTIKEDNKFGTTLANLLGFK